ncbi:MAG: rod-binding protein [Pirellulales bacterium]
MNVASLTSAASQPATPPATIGDAAKTPQNVAHAVEVRDTFRDFVGETLFRQMLKSMRSTVNKPAYFHGGQAEEIFTSQLDEILAEQMAQTDGAGFADRMFQQAFPMHADVIREHATAGTAAGVGLNDLSTLPRR